MVSFANVFELNWIEETPPPFFVEYSCASVCASAGNAGSFCAAARADASATVWVAPVGPEPGADVHDEGAGSTQRDDRDGEQGQHLAVFRP